MALTWKPVVDTRDAAALAEFRAAALPAAAVLERDGRKLFRGYSAVHHPEDPYAPVSGIGQGRRILLQDVPEPKQGKNRLHIDIHSGGELEAVVARLEKLGATRIEEQDQGPAGHWWILHDPDTPDYRF
ncbi:MULTISPECIES: VOC family protein [Kitasatospora]|uniref:Glyoxalase-like domain-containing protein n=1 Tax=Kitasatospora setae (strain ATCC 33774 / DSM 43861 / JCM 3304 / KCC A-0304 / NBRC 14216 / KM-6054) TaxID=452652 RepID=E4N893_KITSK|nr:MULTISPECIES: VOC family protein [Kitasatospora]BAJ27424.1 hypothetical protein KSE_15970 [Kitasatospora setae KM-6054]